MEKEIWKDVEGWEGCYQISNAGILSSVDKKVNSKNGSTAIKRGRIIKCQTDKDGYLRASLRDRHKRVTVIVHRLVAIAFIPNTYNKPQVNHKNGIKTDNMVENLEWCTCSENQMHAFKTGLNVPKKGEDHHSSILKNETIIKIREMAELGVRGMDISDYFKISRVQVCRIIKRKRWNHI